MANTFEVEIDLTNAGLGIQIAGGCEEGNPGVFVVTVNAEGAAAKAGIVPNDQLVAVDGQALSTLTHDEVVALLAGLQVRATVMVTRLQGVVITITDPELSLSSVPPTGADGITDAARSELARRAFATGNVEASKLAHSMPQEKHDHGVAGYVKAAVFGGLDGIITTFAVVASVAGAKLATEVVVRSVLLADNSTLLVFSARSFLPLRSLWALPT